MSADTDGVLRWWPLLSLVVDTSMPYHPSTREQTKCGQSREPCGESSPAKRR